MLQICGCAQNLKTSDEDDDGKKRKSFVDHASLITLVSRLCGRIDALCWMYVVCFVHNLFNNKFSTVQRSVQELFSLRTHNEVNITYSVINGHPTYFDGLIIYKQLIRASRAPNRA